MNWIITLNLSINIENVLSFMFILKCVKWLNENMEVFNLYDIDNNLSQLISEEHFI